MTPSRRAWFYPGINSRIVIPFLMIVLMIAALGIFITTRLVAGSIQERFSNQLFDSALAASNALVKIENDQLANLRLMAFTEGVADAVTSRDNTALQRLIMPLASNGGVDWVMVLDQSARPIIAFAPTGDVSVTIEGAGNLPIVQQTLASEHDEHGDKYAAVLPDQQLMVFSGPVLNPDNQRIGVIVVGLSLRRVVQLLVEQSLSAITLYGLDGRAWASSFTQPLEVLALTAEKRDTLLNGIQNNVTPFDEQSIGDRDYQAIISPLQLRQERLGLLSVALPSEFIVERSSTSRNIFAALFAALFVGVIVVGFAVSRTITLPVSRLVETTRAIRLGDLSTRVHLETPDELGELGESFDAMTDKLVQQNSQISQLYYDQLRETAQRDAVFTSISDVLFVLDSKGKVLQRNANAQELVERLKGNAEDSRLMRDIFVAPQEYFAPRPVQLGSHFYQVHVTEVMLEGNRALGYVAAFQDISALIETERVKDDLVKQMSHELRTPLAAIRGYVDLVKMLESPQLTDQGRQFVDLALDNLSILERMVNEVVDVSVVVSNHFYLDAQYTDVRDIARERFDHWLPAMAKRHLNFRFNAPDLAVCVEIDVDRMAQVIDHILRNAYSYSLEGGQVLLTVGQQAEKVFIRIEDEGVGIGADEVDRVFERMYRGRSADAGPTDARGLGLGLYLSKMIVEAHQGTIDLTSQEGQGTTVTIHLPVREAEGG